MNFFWIRRNAVSTVLKTGSRRAFPSNDNRVIVIYFLQEHIRVPESEDQHAENSGNTHNNGLNRFILMYR